MAKVKRFGGKAWGNALGGHKLQNRVGGRFSSGFAGGRKSARQLRSTPYSQLTPAARRAKYLESKKAEQKKVKRKATAKKVAKTAAVGAVVAGVAAYSARRGFQGSSNPRVGARQIVPRQAKPGSVPHIPRQISPSLTAKSALSTSRRSQAPAPAVSASVNPAPAVVLGPMHGPAEEPRYGVAVKALASLGTAASVAQQAATVKRSVAEISKPQKVGQQGTAPGVEHDRQIVGKTPGIAEGGQLALFDVTRTPLPGGKSDGDDKKSKKASKKKSSGEQLSLFSMVTDPEPNVSTRSERWDAIDHSSAGPLMGDDYDLHDPRGEYGSGQFGKNHAVHQILTANQQMPTPKKKRDRTAGKVISMDGGGEDETGSRFFESLMQPRERNSGRKRGTQPVVVSDSTPEGLYDVKFPKSGGSLVPLKLPANNMSRVYPETSPVDYPDEERGYFDDPTLRAKLAEDKKVAWEMDLGAKPGGNVHKRAKGGDLQGPLASVDPTVSLYRTIEKMNYEWIPNHTEETVTNLAGLTGVPAVSPRSGDRMVSITSLDLAPDKKSQRALDRAEYRRQGYGSYADIDTRERRAARVQDNRESQYKSGPVKRGRAAPINRPTSIRRSQASAGDVASPEEMTALQMKRLRYETAQTWSKSKKSKLGKRSNSNWGGVVI